MTRAALVAVGLLTLAACNAADAEPPPPLDTLATTTTIEPPPTTATPESTTTDSTTTAPETTTTTPTVDTSPPDTTDAEAPSPGDPAFEEAFEAYERAWKVRRAAVAAPGDQLLRAELASYYSVAGFAPIATFLDQLAESDLQAQTNNSRPSQVELIRGEALTADNLVASIVICEVLTDIGIDRESGEIVRDQTDSYLNQVFLRRSDNTWIIEDETTSTRFPNRSGCE